MIGDDVRSESEEESVATETRSVFGEVLAELMWKRRMEPTRENMEKLAADAGLDPDAFMARVGGEREIDVGYLTGVADALDLSDPEKVELALAFTFERRS